MKGGLGQLMKQAQKLQEDMQQAQNELASMEVEGEAGAGMVRVTMTGRHDVRSVRIDADLMSEDKEMLEDLIAAAVNDAVPQGGGAHARSVLRTRIRTQSAARNEAALLDVSSRVGLLERRRAQTARPVERGFRKWFPACRYEAASDMTGQGFARTRWRRHMSRRSEAQPR